MYSMEEVSLKESDLIGREEEIKRLKQSLEGAKESRGSTFLISGEAGIGKTRIIEAGGIGKPGI